MNIAIAKIREPFVDAELAKAELVTDGKLNSKVRKLQAHYKKTVEAKNMSTPCTECGCESDLNLPACPFCGAEGVAEEEPTSEVVETTAAPPALPPTLTSSSKPTIVIGADEHRVTDEVLAVLAKDPTIYRHGGGLATIVRDPVRVAGITRPNGSSRIGRLTRAAIREQITRCADLVQEGKEGEFHATHPPDWLPKAIEARGEHPGFRSIESIVESPVMRADGTILDLPGYDEISGLYYEPNIEFPPVPMRPTQADAARAAELLLGLVSDFPLASPMHGAAWLAAMLTPLARAAITGPTPIVLIDKNVRGCGGSLLADVVGMITTGRPLARMSNPDDDSEARKKITSVALLGDRVVLIDNVEGVLGGSALNAALTAVEWTDRRLGTNEMVRVPLLTVWLASGNNVTLNPDTLRRTLHVRLESPLEHPEERVDVRHPRLLEYVREHRAEFVVAGLTILRAHAVAGRTNPGLRPWGSFEAWSDVVRGAVVFAGLPDPGETRRELATSADREVGALGVLLDAIRRLDFDHVGLTAAELVRLADKRDAFGSEFVHEDLRSAIAELCPCHPGRAVTARSLGSRLAHLRGRVVAGRAIDSVAGRLGAAWRVTEVSR